MVLSAGGTRRPAPGGGPFNTACALARLGVPTAFLGHFSQDEFGRLLANRLAVDGASLALATFGPEPTTIAVANIGKDGLAEYEFLIQGTSAPNLTRQMIPDKLPHEVNGPARERESVGHAGSKHPAGAGDRPGVPAAPALAHLREHHRQSQRGGSGLALSEDRLSGGGQANPGRRCPPGPGHAWSGGRVRRNTKRTVECAGRACRDRGHDRRRRCVRRGDPCVAP